MKITISKNQWEGIGKKAGWMKEAGGAEVGVNQAFSDVADGIKESGKAKVQEYAQRIMKGEPKEKVLEGIGTAFRQNVENALAKMQQSSGQPSQTQPKKYTSQQIIDWSRKTPPEYQKAIARILRDSDNTQIETLNKAVRGDKEAQKWLGEYASQMKTV